MKITEKKQIDALESLEPKEQAKPITYDDESLGQKEESYNKLFDEKLDEIQEVRRKIDYKNLSYNFTKTASGSINFIKFKGLFSLFKKIRDGDTSIEIMEQDQEKFKRQLSQTKSGNPKHKTKYSYAQQEMLKKFMIQDKKLLIYLIITQKLNLNLFIGEKMEKLRQQNVKY